MLMDGNGALRDGKLPARSPDRVSGGLGSGAGCAICGRRVNTDELEFELEFDAGEHGERPARYTVHLQCYSTRKSRRQGPESGRGTVKTSELSGAQGEPKFGVDEREPPTDQGGA
jgi:hypothetical protein